MPSSKPGLSIKFCDFDNELENRKKINRSWDTDRSFFLLKEF